MVRKRDTLRSAALGILAVSLLMNPVGRGAAQTAPPSGTPFGQIGVGAFETARINAYCRADVPPGPCIVGFAFYDTQGRILKQIVLTLMPGRAGSLDIQGMAVDRTALRTQIVPWMKMAGGGAALATLEVFDNQTGASRVMLAPVAVAPQ
jgi:hypothetical protein